MAYHMVNQETQPTSLERWLRLLVFGFLGVMCVAGVIESSYNSKPFSSYFGFLPVALVAFLFAIDAIAPWLAAAGSIVRILLSGLWRIVKVLCVTASVLYLLVAFVKWA